MEKSTKVLVAFLGIAYSRCFYSPIDVDMPASRVNKILEILTPRVVITTRELKEKFKQYSFVGEYLIYEDIIPAETDSDIVAPVSKSILDTDLLYVLFTSGSTGVPKGVGIRHRSVIDYIDWVTSEFGISEEDFNYILKDIGNTKLVLTTIHFHQRGFDYEEDKFTLNFKKVFENYYVKAAKKIKTVRNYDMGGGTPLPTSGVFDYEKWAEYVLGLLKTWSEDHGITWKLVRNTEPQGLLETIVAESAF